MSEARSWINIKDINAFLEAPTEMGSADETRREKVGLLFNALETLFAQYKITTENSGFRLDKDAKTIIIEVAPDDLTPAQKNELVEKLKRALPISQVEMTTDDTTLITITTHLRTEPRSTS